MVAIGDSALYNNGIGATGTQAECNTAVGSKTLYANTTGSYNTASGYNALYSNVSGDNNTANGHNALYYNTTGNYNTACGTEALFANNEGIGNVATGNRALYTNNTGSFNVANGTDALYYNTSGSNNIALGRWSLYDNATTNNNIAIGFSAGDYSTDATNCVMIGYEAGINADNFSNSIALGYSAPITASNQVNIGNTSITSIRGNVGFTTYSDQRFKTNIQTDVKGLDFIMKLRPISYQINATDLDKFLHKNYSPREKNMIDDPSNREALNQKEKIRYTGFLAQEVEQAAKSIDFEFSGVDKPENDNDLYGLRYAEFVVPLVKAVQEQQTIIDTLQQQNAHLQQQIDELKLLITKNK